MNTINIKSFSSSKKIADAKALLEILSMSEKSIQQGKVKNISKAFADLKKSINKFKEEQKTK